MQVAELVPQITLLQRFGIGLLNALLSGERLQDRQTRGLGFMQTGQQRADRLQPRLRPDDQAGPAFTRFASFTAWAVSSGIR